MDLNHVPVIIGNYLPLRFVLRENDYWKPTLEEINNREYDYVKICRLSSFIDIGISPFSLGITFGGSLILPAIESFKNREAAILKFNETLCIMLIGGIYSESVQPTNITYGELFFDGYVKNLGGGSGAISNFHRAIETKYVGTLDVIELLNPKTILNTEIEEAYIKGSKVLSKINKLSPNLLLNGTSHYVKHQWAEGLIFLWSTIEQVIDIIWERKIITDKSNSKNVIEGRRNFLKDFRTWSISTKIEVIFQKELISSSEYQLLSKSRKARNDFVHKGKILNKKIVKDCLVVLFRLISLTISDFKDVALLNDTLENIFANERGDLFPKKNRYSSEEVSHWLSIPPIPGDKDWGDKNYEIIEELVLKPLKK